MPHYNFRITDEGPFFQIHVGVSRPRKNALLAAGKSVPPSLAVKFLVDTGASCTNIDSKIIGKLGVQPTGSVPVHTPSTGSRPINFLTYDVELSIAVSIGGSSQYIPSLSVLESDFSAQEFAGLLGRDFLQYTRMTYCGPEGQVYISL
jgi:hypothetical protein